MKLKLKEAEVSQSNAIFSDCGKYRYWLYRGWSETGPKAMCFGLNPSTANAYDDDPTIASLIRIMKNNGFAGFYMMNLFALISPNPEDLRTTPDPVKENDFYISKVHNGLQRSMQYPTIVFCWGQFPMAEYRSKVIIKQFPKAMCFGRNQNGTPKHPLYLKATTKLIPYDKGTEG
ncbi:MAG: DUF1643 domain-containing protein [Chryseolinea sp.]